MAPDQIEGEFLEACVLGPISVKDAGQQVISGTSKMAALFAALATAPGLTAHSGQIRYYVWQGQEVRGDAFRKAVGAVRKKLGGRVNNTARNLYSISLDTHELDYLRLQELRAQGLKEVGADRLKLLTMALEEFQPEGPLHGLTGAGFTVLRHDLEALWKKTSLERLTAAENAGEHAEVERGCVDLLERWPGWHEVFCVQLRTGHHTGVQRRDLITEWTGRNGWPTDPNVLQTLEDMSKNRPSTRRKNRPVPRQLPSVGSLLCGRQALLSSLAEAIRQQHQRNRLPVIEITGMPGAGKSALARHLAAGIAGGYPGGALYADLLGFSDDAEPVEPEQLLDRFLAALGGRTRAIGVDGKSAELRTALSGRSVLLVLDNAATARQVEPLLPGDSTCAVIITSRRPVTSSSTIPDVHRRHIGPLDPAASQEVLRRELTPASLAQISSHLPELAAFCGHLPLALALIAGVLAKRPPSGVRALVDQLTEESTRLEAMETDNDSLSVRMALRYSVSALSPEAALLLWQTAIHPGPIISWSALRDLGRAAPGAATVRAIDELTEAHLLERAAEESDESEHYRLHDLVRVYARHHAGQQVAGTSQGLKERTIHRALEYALHQVAACDRILDPTRELSVGEPGDSEVTLASGEDAAMRLLDLEYQTLLSLVDLAVEHRSKRHMWLLPMALVTYQWRRGFHAEAYRTLEHSRSAASDTASCAELAMVHRMMASSRQGPDHYVRSSAHLHEAVALSRQHGGDTGRMSLAWSLHALATLCRLQGMPTEARDHSVRALEIFREMGSREGEAAALNGLGTLSHDLGDYEQALGQCTAALQIFRTGSDRNATANVLTTLGKIYHSRSEYRLAFSVYEQALEIYRQLDYRPNEAKFLRRYAVALLNGGETCRAVDALERAALLLEQLGGDGLEEVLAQLAALR